MIPRIPAIFCALFALTMLQLHAAQEFEYGSRPPNSVFDPTGVIAPERVKEISDPLAVLMKNEGIDVIVVLLTDLQDAPPAHVAGRFMETWCKSPLHGIVMHVPGRTDSPWIIPAGRLVEYLDPDQVQRAVADAQRRAAAEPDDFGKIKAATEEAADVLRYWTANAVNRSEMIQTEATKFRLSRETRARGWKIAALVGGGSLILLVAGISFLVMILRSRGPGYFPNQTWQFRLGAPHSGGNHAVAELGSPLP